MIEGVSALARRARAPAFAAPSGRHGADPRGRVSSRRSRRSSAPRSIRCKPGRPSPSRASKARPPMKVVESVMAAQRSLQTVLAIRDKAVAAYQEIARMAI